MYISSGIPSILQHYETKPGKMKLPGHQQLGFSILYDSNSWYVQQYGLTSTSRWQQRTVAIAYNV